MKIKKQNRTGIVLVLALIAVATSLAVWFFFYNASHTGPDDINYSPATEDDKELNDRIKQDLPAKNDVNTSQPVTSVRSVKPVASAWGQPSGPGTDFQLNGFVDGIVESGGTCTLTMEKGSQQTATVTKKALQNAQNTSCGQMVISYTKLTPGAWQATLSYTSPASEGSSDPVMVEVK